MGLLVLAAAVQAAGSNPHVQVRIVTGATELSAGSELELRIYETGKPPRHVPLTHGEAWPRDSTRIIPVTLPESFDARAVSRFSLYYRPSSPLTPPLEIVSADVDLVPGQDPPRYLLNTKLSGVITRQGELATDERDPTLLTCMTDADCDDQRNCNGHERCAPRTAGADARGCVRGSPMVCPVNEVCTEDKGCRGP